MFKRSAFLLTSLFVCSLVCAYFVLSMFAFESVFVNFSLFLNELVCLFVCMFAMSLFACL